MSKPGGFGTMTAIRHVRAHWRRESSMYNGLTGICRNRYRPNSKSSRNVKFLVGDFLKTLY